MINGKEKANLQRGRKTCTTFVAIRQLRTHSEKMDKFARRFLLLKRSADARVKL